jgi:hypothetical protein
VAELWAALDAMQRQRDDLRQQRDNWRVRAEAAVRLLTDWRRAAIAPGHAKNRTHLRVRLQFTGTGAGFTFPEG